MYNSILHRFVSLATCVLFPLCTFLRSLRSLYFRSTLLHSFHCSFRFQNVVSCGLDPKWLRYYVRCSFDPETKRWTQIAPMIHKRLAAGTAVVNRYLYVVGGFDGNQRLASVEQYHPEENRWTLCPPMPTQRYGAGMHSRIETFYCLLLKLFTGQKT